MKLYFVTQQDIGDEYAPVGLASLAAYIKEKIKNIDIRILDHLSEKQIKKIIEKEKPDFIGFSSASVNFYKFNIVARELKKISPKSYMVVGGPHITVSPKSFKKSSFDIGVVGEGEITLEEILKVYLDDKEKFESQLKKIKGVLFGKNPVIYTGHRELIKDLSSLPVPARDLLDMRYYSLPKLGRNFRREANIMTSRGCPYNCTYCSSCRVWERRVRFISAERVVEDIEILHKKYHINYILIWDDIFSVNKPRMKEIIDLLREKKILGKIDFECNARANGFDEDTAKLLKEMNTISVRFGFESGSEKILKQIKKGSVTVKDNIRASEICRKYKLPCYGYIMLGNPDETEQDLIDTYNFTKKYTDLCSIAKTNPFPGTELWDYAVNKGLIDENYYDVKRPKISEADFDLMFSDKISKEKFKELFYKIGALQPKPQLNLPTSKIPKIIPWLFNPYFISIKLDHLKNKYSKQSRRQNYWAS